MNIEFDEEKRLQTLEHRGLDFADAAILSKREPSCTAMIASSMERFGFRRSASWTSA